MPKLNKKELIDHVKQLLSGDWDDEEMERLFREINENVPCPDAEIQEYIFLSDGLSPEEMVQKMLDYQVIRL